MLSPEHEALNAQAQQELDAEKGDMNHVIDLTTQVINDHPNAKSHRLRSDAHFELNNQKAAFADTNQSIRLDPRDAELVARRGILNFSRERMVEAHKDFSAAVDLEPDNPNYLIFRSQTSVILHNLPEARLDIDKAFKLNAGKDKDPNVEFAARLQRAELLIRGELPDRNTYIEAFTDTTIAQELPNEDDSELLRLRSISANSLMEPRLAYHDAQILPFLLLTRESYNIRAEALQELGFEAVAQKDYEIARYFCSDTESTIETALKAELSGENQAAYELFNGVLPTFAEQGLVPPVELIFHRGIASWGANNHEAAIQDFAAARSADALNTIDAMLHWLRKKVPDGGEYPPMLLFITDDGGGFLRRQKNRAIVLMAEGLLRLNSSESEPVIARAYLNAAVEALDSDHSDASVLVSLAVACKRMGEENPKVISFLDEAIDRLKENTTPFGRNHAQALKAVINAEMGNFDQALDDLENAIPTDPELFKPFYKVLIAIRLKIQQGASNGEILTDTSYTDLFERIVSLKLLPPTQALHNVIAINDLTLHIATEDEEASVASYFQRGIIHMKIDQPKKAIDDFTRVLEIDPTHVEAQLCRIMLYQKTKEFSKYLDEVSKVKEMALDPEKLEMHLERVQTLLTEESASSTEPN